ncbi:hypothetical protein K470DRAFT_237297 [Piedraia hortae CBS 480.64]|uniref:NACHT domain-containing protein n=1 Tax=Piedraia hortae CBS 480.64 TaxID=1314780 RepID=A0A6A7BS38_9PEZI|nr:hypothetical protein K470DRAFT_237297 [Piedraia hortae CBS 480.64]
MHARHFCPSSDFSLATVFPIPDLPQSSFSLLSVPAMRPRSKDWREKARSVLPISPTPQPSSPHSASTQAANLGRTPETSFKDRDRLLHDALNHLSEDDRKFIEKQLYLPNDPARNEAGLVALRERCQKKKSDSYCNRMRKITGQIMHFVPVFDVATNAQAEVLSLPWAGIRSLLMVAQKAHEQSEALLEGIETTLDTGLLLNVYFDVYGRLSWTPAIGGLYYSIVKLYCRILKFVAHAEHTGDMSRFGRLVQSVTSDVLTNFKNDHRDLLMDVEHHKGACDSELTLHQRDWVNKELESLKINLRAIEAGVNSVQQTLDLNALQSAAGATYDSTDAFDLVLCLGDTRVEIIKEIVDWATTVGGQRVYWLSGKAGTGKSTIARTVAHELESKGHLVGSYFFKRGKGELSRARNLFPTIACQMANFIPDIRDKIAVASHGSPAVIDRSLANQFDTLIKQPLSGYSTCFATQDVRVIVIDALDECDAKDQIGQAMTLWPTLNDSSLHLKVFVTSRSDNEIWTTLGHLGPESLQHKRLEDLQTTAIKHDLTLFCKEELRKIREKQKKNLVPAKLDHDWPGEDVVQKLVEISQPLFIAASTILKDVSTNPRRLPQWVARLNSTGPKALTKIYMDILQQAFDLDEEWHDWFDQVIKPIALLYSPLSLPALTDLLAEGDEMIVANALNPLSSVIEFPSSVEMESGSPATVQIYHESFRDFLLDPTVKGEPPFWWINKKETHGDLLARCLNLLQTKLCRNLCKLKDLATKRESVSAENIEKHIPEPVQYACRNWVSHAVDSSQTIGDVRPVDHFLRGNFLYWTEAMAWLDKLGEVIVSLKQLQKDVKLSPATQSLVADALRWVPANRSVISDTPLQTYLSALAFAPSNSVVRSSFKHEMDDFLQAWSPVESSWDAELQMLKGHTSNVKSIASSADGKRLVTAAADRTVRIWDIVSGTEEDFLEVESVDAVSSISEEEVVLIAGLDGKLSRWNVKKDIRQIELTLPGNAKCVSVSPNSRYAAWGLDTGTIYLWDVENGSERLLEGHDLDVNCMAFSSDGETIVSGSYDVWMWSARTGHKMICEVDANIEAIAISPDGKFVVFDSGGGFDMPTSVSVFHCDSHHIDQILTGQASRHIHITQDSQMVLISTYRKFFLYEFRTRSKPRELSMISPTPMGTISSSSDAKTIWVEGGERSVTQLDVDVAFKSKQAHVTIAAMSTDGQSIASWSKEGKLSFWSIERRICEQQLTDVWPVKIFAKSHTILISPDSHFVVVALLHHTPLSPPLIWDLQTNELIALKNDPSFIGALAISPDSKTLLCSLRNGHISTFESKSGNWLKTVTGHTTRINNISFSPNGQEFASVSEDQTVRIWSLQSENPLVLIGVGWLTRACFWGNGRMLYVLDSMCNISEWDIEKAYRVRRVRRIYHKMRYDELGLTFFDGRFVQAGFLPFLPMLEAREVDQAQTQVDSSASATAVSKFKNHEIWALEVRNSGEKWITVNNLKIFKAPTTMSQARWMSHGRIMVFSGFEDGPIVLNFTGKNSF